jgi:hypothetical protein
MDFIAPMMQKTSPSGESILKHLKKSEFTKSDQHRLPINNSNTAQNKNDYIFNLLIYNDLRTNAERSRNFRVYPVVRLIIRQPQPLNL